MFSVYAVIFHASVFKRVLQTVMQRNDNNLLEGDWIGGEEEHCRGRRLQVSRRWASG